MDEEGLQSILKDMGHNITLNSKEIIKMKNVIVSQEAIIQAQNEKIKVIQQQVF